jgi:hypothetical protein
LKILESVLYFKNISSIIVDLFDKQRLLFSPYFQIFFFFIKERKLDKLKGKTKDVSAKDVINSLSAKRDALFQQFLQSNVGHEYDFDVETHDSNISNNSSVYSLVERRLFPQSQAITAEELQRLLEADILDKINSNNSSDK